MRVEFEPFVFDDDARRVTRDGAPIHLSPKAFQLLQILIARRPAAVSKQDLIAQIWPDVVVEEANLKVLISEVRRALSDDSRQSRYIRTVQRYGYAFGDDAGGDAPARRSAARLIGDMGTYPLGEGENAIGRDPRCRVTITSVGVSRRHAAIDVGSRIVLRDLGSKNGTRLNGARVTGEVQLNDGDEIRIGTVSLTFRSRESVESTETLDGSS